MPKKIFQEKLKTTFGFRLKYSNIDLPKALINNQKEVGSYRATKQNHFQTKNQEEALDTINVLYVALTRAEEQLYVISK